MIGSGELRSLQELVTPISWLVVSSGVRGVSAGVSGAIKIGEAFRVRVTSVLEKLAESERLELSSARTREWKCGVVIGVVSISYYPMI